MTSGRANWDLALEQMTDRWYASIAYLLYSAHVVSTDILMIQTQVLKYMLAVNWHNWV